AHVVDATGSRVHGPLVHGDVEHARVAPEDVLGAVAVVGVVVHDHHPFAPVGQCGGGDGHVVHQAEPHGPVGGGVVTRRAHRAEGRAGLAGFHPSYGLETRTGRQLRGLPRSGAHVGVTVQVTAPGGAELGESARVALGMHPQEVFRGGGHGHHRHHGFA